MTGQFTGRHMSGILISFFAVVIVVNVAMARLATSTFGGEVVENSYVASQHFNRWLDEAAKSDSQGIKAFVSRTHDDHLSVVFPAAPVTGKLISAVARHPLGRTADRTLTFARVEPGRFVSREVLPAGRWRVRIALDGGGTIWRSEQDVP